MKRSSAIDIINNMIEGYMNPASSRRIAENILNKLEETKMLRPYHIVEELFQPTDRWTSWPIGDPVIIRNHIPTWEPEDEKK